MSPRSKLRRLTRGGGEDAGNGKMLPDWTSLHTDLVELIGCRVLAGDLQDYVRFRAVCSHWSASTARPRGRGVLDARFHPRRWMMLPEGHSRHPGHPDFGGFVRFFNLDTGAFARAHLPLLADHVILDSADGLLVLHRNDDTAIRLLHPFTGDVAEFPPLASLLPQMQFPRHCDEQTKRRKLMIARACVAVSSSGAITLMLALPRMNRVAYATAGDQRWTTSAWKFEPFLIPVAFQGKLYAYHQVETEVPYEYIDIGKVSIYQFDPPCPDADGDGQPRRLPLPVKITECPTASGAMVHFVEWCSELLLVCYKDVFLLKPLIYRVADLVSGKIEPVKDIGDHTLFIGDRSVCVSLSPNKESRTRTFPSMSPNSIIRMRCSTRLRFELYDLSTGIWTPKVVSKRFWSKGVSKIPPSSPYTLIHHIFTSCEDEFWAKGSMYGFETQPRS